MNFLGGSTATPSTCSSSASPSSTTSARSPFVSRRKVSSSTSILSQILSSSFSLFNTFLILTISATIMANGQASSSSSGTAASDMALPMTLSLPRACTPLNITFPVSDDAFPYTVSSLRWRAWWKREGQALGFDQAQQNQMSQLATEVASSHMGMWNYSKTVDRSSGEVRERRRGRNGSEHFHPGPSLPGVRFENAESKWIKWSATNERKSSLTIQTR